MPAPCLVMKDYPMSKRDCLKAIGSHTVWSYFEGNSPLKWAAFIQNHMASEFETETGSMQSLAIVLSYTVISTALQA